MLFNTESDRNEGREDGQAVETVLEDMGRLEGVREDGPILPVCGSPPHSPSAVQARGVGPPEAGSGLVCTGRSGEASGSRACCEELDSWLACPEGGRSTSRQRFIAYGRAVCNGPSGSRRAEPFGRPAPRIHPVRSHARAGACVRARVRAPCDLAERHLNGGVFFLIDRDLPHVHPTAAAAHPRHNPLADGRELH